MLLGMSSDEFLAWELLVDLSCDVSLEASEGFFLGAAFFDAAVDVVLCSLVVDHAGDHDVPERGVGLTVASPVEAVTFLLAAAGVDG